MKSILSIAFVWLVALQLSAQTFEVKGRILNAEKGVNLKVFEFSEPDGWTEVNQLQVKNAYSVRLDIDKDYQIWFTDKEDLTKVLAVNKETILSAQFDLNVDFSRTYSVQILRDPIGLYNLVMIDTDFMSLNTPWDLYSTN